MVYSLLPAALLDGIIIIALAIWIRYRYRLALTSVEEKSAGQLFFYRVGIAGVFHSKFTADGLVCFIQYLALHLLLPLWGFAFFLKTDANFLVVILSLIWSAQLVQRLYPGTHESEEE